MEWGTVWAASRAWSRPPPTPQLQTCPPSRPGLSRGCRWNLTVLVGMRPQSQAKASPWGAVNRKPHGAGAPATEERAGSDAAQNVWSGRKQ